MYYKKILLLASLIFRGDYRWSTVAEWFYRQQKIKDHEVIDFANVIEDINAALDSRDKEAFVHRQKILNELERRVG